uniref:DNA topoisomerase n=1 Tax=Panagrellus redivivus TaxID=6233 RepID=A0A7E4W9B3_PANRE
MDASVGLFFDLQYVIVVFLTLFAGTVLGLGLCGKARRPEAKVDDPARRARMQNLLNRTDKAASDVEVSEGRALAREGPGEYRSKRQPPRKQLDHDDDDGGTSRSKPSEYRHEDRGDRHDRSDRHERSDRQDRSGSKRKKKHCTDVSRKRSRIYGITESKRGKHSKENLSRDMAEPGKTPDNKTPAAVEYKSNESKQRSARNDGGGGHSARSPRSPRESGSPKRNAQSPRQASKENSHSKRTKVITFEKNNSKSRRSNSVELPVDVTQDDHSPQRRDDPEAFPFKDKSQASQEASHKSHHKRRSPRGKTADLQETQTLNEDVTQNSNSESRVTRSRIRQISELPPASGVTRTGSPKKKKYSSSVMTAVSKEDSKDKDGLDRSKKSREGVSRLDKSDKRSREGGLDQSNKSGRNSVSGRKKAARKKASQEKHEQLKEIRRSVNKKLKSRTDEDASAESPFGEKGKKTRKEDAEHIKSQKIRVQSPTVDKPNPRDLEKTQEQKQALALYPNTTATRTDADGDSGRSSKTKSKEVPKVPAKSPKRKPPVEDADPDSQTGRVSPSSNLTPREQSSTAKTDPKEKTMRLKDRTCKSPSVGVTFEGLPSRQRVDHTQEATLTTVTAPDKTLTTQTAADSTAQTQKTQNTTRSVGTGLNTLEMTAIQTEKTQKTSIAPTQVDPTVSQKTQTTQKTVELVTAAERTRRTHRTQNDDKTEDLFSPAVQKTQVDTKSLVQTAKSDARSRTQKTQVGTKTDEGLHTEKTQKVSEVKTAEAQQKSVTCKSSDYVPHVEGPETPSEKDGKVASDKEESVKSVKKKKLSSENGSSKKSISTSSKKKPKKKLGSKSVELEPPKDSGHNLYIAPLPGSISQLPSSSGASSSKRRKKKGKVATVPSKNKAIDSLDCRQNTLSMVSVEKPNKSGGTTAEGSIEKRGGDGGVASVDTIENSVEMPTRKKSGGKSKSIMADPTQKSQKLDSSNKSMSSKIKSKAKSKLASLMKSPVEKDLEKK